MLAMSAWKSSTLLVFGAFTISVVLLLAKSGMVAGRTERAEVRVTSHIYSPAAADPELRDPERAERLRRSAKPQARTTSTRTTVVREPKRATPPAGPPKSTPAPRTAKASLASTPPAEPLPRHEVPANHRYYVILATFSSLENAKRGRRNLEEKGLSGCFVGSFDEGKYYSVIGRTFANEESARYMVNEIVTKYGLDPYIYFKRDEE